VEIQILLIFVSAVFVAAAVAFFVWSLRQQTFDHGIRLSLLPLEEPASPTPPPGDSRHV
jgi:hypothetical protein